MKTILLLLATLAIASPALAYDCPGNSTSSGQPQSVCNAGDPDCYTLCTDLDTGSTFYVPRR